jgi:hypothetical protein
VKEVRDPFHPDNFRLNRDEVRPVHHKNGAGKTKPARKRHREIEFYKFPQAVVDGIRKAKYPPAMLLVAAVLETYYDDYEKRNPVRLTSKKLKGYGISRNQKMRGLKVLEGTDQFSIERSPRQNPLIFLKWELTKD